MAGQFQRNGILISGREVALTSMRNYEDSLIMELQYSSEFGPIIIQDVATDTK